MTVESLASDRSVSASRPTMRVGFLQLVASECRLQFRKSPRLLGALAGAALVCAALSASGRVDLSDAISVQVVFLGAVVLGLLPMSGVVSDDLASRFVYFLLQKGRSVRPYYLTVASARLVGIGTMSLAVALVLSLAPLALHGASLTEVRYTLFLPATAVLIAAIVFAMSAHGLAKDMIAAMIYVLSSSIVAYKLASASGAWVEVLRFLCFPLDALLEVSGAGGHRPGSPPSAAVLVVQVALWLTVGALGVDGAARRRV